MNIEDGWTFEHLRRDPSKGFNRNGNPAMLTAILCRGLGDSYRSIARRAGMVEVLARKLVQINREPGGIYFPIFSLVIAASESEDRTARDRQLRDVGFHLTLVAGDGVTHSFEALRYPFDTLEAMTEIVQIEQLIQCRRTALYRLVPHGSAEVFETKTFPTERTPLGEPPSPLGGLRDGLVAAPYRVPAMTWSQPRFTM